MLIKENNLYDTMKLKQREAALHQAISNVGGVSKLATKLGISQPSISGWERVPPHRVLEVERATGVSRYDLRARIYTPETSEMKPGPSAL